MALTSAQIQVLNDWSKTQTGLKPFNQIDGTSASNINLGTMFDSGTILSNDNRDKYVSVSLVLPAPAGGAVTKDFPMFEAPAGGQLVSVKLVPSAAWSAGNNKGDTYLLNARRYNNTAANLGFTHDASSGIAAGFAALLPTGSSNQLLTAGQAFTITASGASITLNNAIDFINLPAIGDYLSINCSATQAAGTNTTLYNSGVFQITAASSSYIVATKLWGHDPETVNSVSAVATDVTGVRLIRSSEATFSAGDTIGLRVVVPINTTTPVDVSALNFVAVLRYRLT